MCMLPLAYLAIQQLCYIFMANYSCQYQKIHVLVFFYSKFFGNGKRNTLLAPLYWVLEHYPLEHTLCALSLVVQDGGNQYANQIFVKYLWGVGDKNLVSI